MDPTTWSYGYELCKSLNMKAGTVYPILVRLAERGQVETAWEDDPEPGRPRRHLYRLSSKGAELVAAIEQTRHAAKPRAASGPAAVST